MSNKLRRLIESPGQRYVRIRGVLSGKRGYLLIAALLASVLALSLSGTDRQVTAQGTFPDPNANCPHATCGEVSPLIPMQSSRSGSHGSGLEEEFHYAQNIVSRQISGVHTKRYCGSRVN